MPKQDKSKTEEPVVEEVKAEEPVAEEVKTEEPVVEAPAEPAAPANEPAAPASGADTSAPASNDPYGRQLYEITCSNCGKKAQVPFKPSGDRPVYCRECYAKQREQGNR